MTSNTLLLAIGVPFYRKDGTLYVERQADNGLRLWAENFDKVGVIARVNERAPPIGWIPWEASRDWAERISFSLLPEAYRPDKFARHLGLGRQVIREQIERYEYLCFAIGGLFGDWGSVASLEAIRMRRPFSIWTDRVESNVVRTTASQGPLQRRVMSWLTYMPMAQLERHIVRHAALGLFHGGDTYETYAPFSPHPVLVHDVHFGKDDHVSDRDLATKQAEIKDGQPRLLYAGRIAAMKGWRDWLEVVSHLQRAGMSFSAEWLGDGDDRAAFLEERRRLGLEQLVSAPGNIDDRAELRRRLESGHLLLFCHKTKESPRILIEALRSGMPIVGYRGAFAADLIAANGGGVLTTPDSPVELANAVLALNGDRARWADLIGRARLDGEDLYDEAVFRHRSDVIKMALSPSGGQRRAQ